MSLDKQKIVNELNSKGATRPCHRCGSTQFSVVDGYSSFGLQDDFSKGVVLGGRAMPVAMVICTNCGAITPHALGALSISIKEGE